MISITEFLSAEMVAAVLLALWVVSRFPQLGPKSLRSACVGIGVAFLVLEGAPFEVDLFIRLPHGAYLALFGCVLPTFFVTFLAAGWLMRLLANALGGSGGGGGHRVPARSNS